MSILLLRRKPKPRRRRRRVPRKKPHVSTSTRISNLETDADLAAEEAEIAAEMAAIDAEERQLKKEELEYEALARKAKIIDVSCILIGLALVATGGLLAVFGYGKEKREDKIFKIGGPALIGIGIVFILLGVMSRLMTIETPEVDEESA